MTKNSLGCILTSDVFKLRKLKSVWIAIIMILLISLITFVSYALVESTIKGLDPSNQEEADLIVITKLMALELKISTIFGSTLVCMVELFVAIIACIFIGKDFSNGAIQLMIARGVKKRDIYLSKLMTMSTLIVFYAIVSLLINGILIAIVGFGNDFSALDWGYLFRNFFTQIVAGIASASIFVMITFLCRSSGSSLACSIVGYIVLALLISILSTIPIDSMSNDSWTHFMPLNQMSVASTYGEWDIPQICAISIMPVVYTILSTIIGYITFVKRDIK